MVKVNFLKFLHCVLALFVFYGVGNTTFVCFLYTTTSAMSNINLLNHTLEDMLHTNQAEGTTLRILSLLREDVFFRQNKSDCLASRKPYFAL